MKITGKVAATVTIALIVALGVFGSAALSGQNIVREEGQWSDATDVLSGRAATEAGRQARDPLINTEQGNMLVFFFCLGGVIGGLIIGYNCRRLLVDEE